MAATIQDAVQAVNVFNAKVDNLITETTNANNRFDAKIAALQAQITDLQTQITTLQGQVAAGSDAQPVLDALTPLSQKIDNQTAAEQVEGV